jgi:hypothetical protein
MAVPSQMVIYLFLTLLESVIRSAGQSMGVIAAVREEQSYQFGLVIIRVCVSELSREESESDDRRFALLF